MTSHVNVSGVWKDLPEIHVNVGGTWKECDTVHVNVGGTWQEVHAKSAASTPPAVAATWANGSSNASSITVTISGINTGDLLIAQYSCGDWDKNPTTPTGFTLGNETDVADGTGAWWWKIADGGETSVAVVHGNPKNAIQVTVAQITGANGAPIDVSSANSGSGTSSVGTSVTTSVDNTLLLHMAMLINANLPTHTPPSGFTEEQDNYQDDSSSWTANAFSWDEQATAGASGDKTGTWTQTGNWVTHLVAIKPS